MPRKYSKIEQICQPIDSYGQTNFLLFKTKEVYNWNIVEDYKKGIFMGEGSFGEVRRVFSPINNLKEEIAIKKLSIKDKYDLYNFLEEIEALEQMVDSNYAPYLFGCSYKDQSVWKFWNYLGQVEPEMNLEVFIPQQLLFSDLDDEAFISTVDNLGVRETLELWIQMFKGVRDLWDRGFAHNDIKPGNMMTNKKFNRIFLIDFGLVSRTHENSINGGTPLFMSPPKYERGMRVKEIDDLYSVALSILTLESDLRYDIFKKDIHGKTYEPLVKTQFDRSLQRRLLGHALKILEPIYGKYQNRNPLISEINFTTLIYDMIKYDHFKFTTLEVISVISRLIESEKIKEQEAEELKKKHKFKVEIQSRKKLPQEQIEENNQKVLVGLNAEKKLNNLNREKHILLDKMEKAFDKQPKFLDFNPKNKPIYEKGVVKKEEHAAPEIRLNSEEEQIKNLVQAEIKEIDDQANIIVQKKFLNKEKIIAENDRIPKLRDEEMIQRLEEKVQPVKEKWEAIYDELMKAKYHLYLKRKFELEKSESRDLLDQLDLIQRDFEWEKKLTEEQARRIVYEKHLTETEVDGELARAEPVVRAFDQRVIPKKKKIIHKDEQLKI